jgi:hypothetical protein
MFKIQHSEKRDRQEERNMREEIGNKRAKEGIGAKVIDKKSVIPQLS